MKLINTFKLKADFYELDSPESAPLRHIKMSIINSIFSPPSLKIFSGIPWSIPILMNTNLYLKMG